MIKVKTFDPNSANPLHHERLDNEINSFIANNDIEVIDIKYSTAFAENQFIASALLVYKEK